MRRWLAILALMLVCAPARAQQPAGGADLPAAVAEPLISVGSDYRGSVIDVWGVNTDRRLRGDIVVVVRGPNQAATVMHKRRVFGLWINSSPVRFSETPSFFAVLSARPLRQIVSRQVILRNRLDPAATAQLASAVPAGADPSAYREALVRLRRDQGLYQEFTGPPSRTRRSGLTPHQGGLFHAVVRLPANAPIAAYQVETYLFREGRLMSSQRLPISIERVGVERRIHDLATNASWLYGIVTVLIALGAGWAAAVLFRRS